MSKQGLIEDIYPLSPMQEGMLFHALRSPEAGLYFEQVTCTLAGDLDEEAFVGAWQQVVDRHPILRTAFVWERRKEPFQVAFRRVELPWERHDWTGRPPAEQARSFAALVAADRQRGFQLSKPPLMRQALVRTAADRHRLLWSCHHLLLDGWSQTLVIQEVMTAYHARCQGRAESPAPSRPYADYIAWLRRQDLGRAESFWRGRLDGFELPTPLPGGKASGGTGTPGRRDGECELALSAELTAALQSFAQHHRLTLNTLVQGAWALLLNRHTGQDDVVFGVTVSGRPPELAGIESMKGLFVNTLPLRVALPEGSLALPWLTELRRQQAEAASFEHTPLPAIQRWSQVPPGQPLFETILAFESYPMDGALLDWGPRLRVCEVQPLGRTNYPLALMAVPGPRLALRIAWDADRCEGTTARRLAGHLASALAAFVAQPAGRLSELPLLSDAERHQLVVEWRDTAAPYPSDRCLHQLFAAQAALAPDAVAVVAEEEQLTRGELARRANRLARRLRRLGVVPEAAVGLLLDRSPQMLVAMLGILEAGGAYLPLDPAFPAERLALLLEDAGAAVLVTTAGMLSRLPPRRPPTLCLDAGADGADGAEGWLATAEAAQAAAAGGGPPQPLEPPGHPEQLAYLIYTSGSTGLPKGVAVSHRAVVRLVRGNNFASLAAGEVFLQLAPLAFDASTLEIWGSLANGGRLVLMPPGQPELEPIGAAVARHGVTTLWLTAGLFHLMVDQRLADLRPLRQLLAGGDVLLPAQVERVRRELPDCRLINGYGPTEGTTFTCCCQLTDLPPGAAGSVPIGWPIRNTWVTVLDAHLRPVPLGAPGELAAGGDGLARGYLGRPDLTAERFVPDPFANRPGERLYRSGDLVRHRVDGSLEFLRRIDRQVKVRGFRVEPGEIETALEAQASVRQAVVVARRDLSGDHRLVAYVVGGGEQAPSPEDLRDELRRRLPEAMVPAAIVVLAALPLTASGKVDRKALPAPGEEPRPLVAPRTPLEARLAEIWCQVLGLPRVSVTDSFFALGGDSIASMHLTGRARQAGIELTPGQVFEHSTIADLAAMLASREAAPGGREAMPASPPAGAEEPPLTPIERWFFERQSAAPHHFNMSLPLSTAPELGAPALRAAVTALVRHHEALRLRFVPAGDSWRRQLGAAAAASFCHLDLSAVPAAAAAAWESAAARVQASLDLTAGPLLRAVFCDRGPGRPGRLLLAVHHLVVDAVSWRILLEDLVTACRQHQRGEAVVLPAATTSFRSWAGRLAEHARSPAVAATLPVWLAASPASRLLPLDRIGGCNGEGTAARVTRSLDAVTTERWLRQAPRRSRLRPEELLLTALVQALAAWAGAGTFRLDLERHGREAFAADLDLSRTVGWFTSIFPIELTATPETLDEEPGAALAAVTARLRAVPGNGLSWGLLRYGGGTEGVSRLRRLPAAEVSFNYLGQLDEAATDGLLLAPAAEPCGPQRGPRLPRSHLLEVSASVENGRLQLEWAYSEALHRQATIERVADGCVTALRALIAHCLGGTDAVSAVVATPSDFPLAAIDQTTLDRLLAGGQPIEDLYPLAPLQHGLLFHGLSAPASGEYVVQLSCRFDRPLDAARFRRAWQQVVARHPVLRTAFHWQGLTAPLQAVVAAVEPPWRELDWRAVEPGELPARLAAWLEEDRRRGFDLRQAPLLRVALLWLGDGSCQFVFSIHHLLVDGWSLSLLLAEVFAFYVSPSPQLAPSRPYRDFIAWLARQDRERAEEYWRGLLGSFTRPTALGGERRRGETGHGEVEGTLPAIATAQLAAMARRCRLTLSTLVMGAWGLLLGRISGEQEVVFGVTVSGRSAALAGFESMVGLFVNTLPVRLQLPAELAALPWLEGLQRQQLAIQRLEYSPLAAVQGWSGVPAGQELFASAMVFENYPVDATVHEAAASLGCRDVRSLERTHYALNLIAEPGRELRLRLAHDRGRFDGVAVQRMMLRLLRLLAGLAPERRLGELHGLGPGEVHQLLMEWNDTASDYPRAPGLAELFAAQAAARPEAAAVVDEGGETWSYRRLDAASSRLARHLRSRGVERGEAVAIAMERSAELVVGLLGILKAGGAYVPLDPSYPDQRLASMLAGVAERRAGTGGVSPVLVHGRTRERMAGLARDLVCWDRDREEIMACAAIPPAARTTAADLAYVVYTSGSTGRPNGVAVPQRAVTRLVRGTDYARLGADDRLAHLSNVSFDAATFEVWGALLNGGALVVIGREVLLSPPAFAARLRETGVTAMFLTAALFNQVVRDEPAAFQTVRHLLVGGEALDPAAVARALAGGAPRRLLNGYGPTESTTFAVWHEVRAIEPGALAVPIGRPLANTTALVLDAAAQLVAPGGEGELCLGGDGLAWGYLHQPELTAERFVPHPWSAAPGDRLYRTGDLARRRADGAIDFLGRIDQQVKIRGHRIELGEIEAALQEHPAVREAVVACREDGPGGKRLVAYLVAAPAGGGPGSVAAPAALELRAFLQRRLPEFMVPADFVTLEELPLSPNHKVNRRALPPPENLRRAVDGAYVAPRTAVERQLAAIWAAVLQLDRVGSDDNFFALGGDSILSIQVAARAGDAGLRITPKQLFENPRLGALAAVAEPVGEVAAEHQEEWHEASAEVPLTPIQSWFFELDLPRPQHFNMALLLEIRRQLATPVLAAAARAVAAHHDVFRLRFSRRDGEAWRQARAEGDAPPVPIEIDLASLPPAARAGAITAAAELLHRSLDLTRGPLLRLARFQLGAPLPGRLLIVAHHLVMDAVSWGILVQDLATACEQLSGRAPVALPAATLSFKRWSQRLSEHARSPALAADTDRWLAPSLARPARLPVDRPGGANREGAGRTVEVALTAGETAELLGETLRPYRLRIDELLLTALAMTVEEWTGSAAVLVDVEGHGREEIVADLRPSRTVGWFTCLVPVVLELPRGGDPGAALVAVKEQLRRLPHRGIGHGLLRYLGDPAIGQRLRQQPSPEVSFNYLGRIGQAAPESGLFARALEPIGTGRDPLAPRTHLLEVNAAIAAGGELRIELTHSAELHHAATIERLARRYREHLHALMRHCRSAAAGRFTPADFPLAELDQQRMDRLAARFAGKRPDTR
jgi:amino acid adenylation domain-containing protein/non-ribosomal peptide synthase protein (TIGR01720 family)